jgi:hypothetical protein
MMAVKIAEEVLEELRQGRSLSEIRTKSGAQVRFARACGRARIREFWSRQVPVFKVPYQSLEQHVLKHSTKYTECANSHIDSRKALE